jgi:antitoxin component YwqK of YwqJK toxin-antitoxin module
MKEVITTFDNGKVKEKYSIDVNGKKEGEYISYYGNGNVDGKCIYHNDKKEGEFILYHINGIVSVKCNYHDDKLEGEYITYYKNGSVNYKCNFHNGMVEGEYISYYGNGNIREKCNFHDDKKDGEFVEYYENGNIVRKCNYHDDKREGEYLKYNESNELIEHRIYKNDCIVKYLIGEYSDNIITLIENEVKKEDDYCLICRDEKDNKELIKLSCCHIYHKKCLVQWMKQIKNELCPMCQHEIDWSKASNLQ